MTGLNFGLVCKMAAKKDPGKLILFLSFPLCNLGGVGSVPYPSGVKSSKAPSPQHAQTLERSSSHSPPPPKKKGKKDQQDPFTLSSPSIWTRKGKLLSPPTRTSQASPTPSPLVRPERILHSCLKKKWVTSKSHSSSLPPDSRKSSPAFLQLPE